MIKIYNTLTKNIDELKPIDSTVRIYSCGPTVYDKVHIGNLSSFIITDTINRVLSSSKFKVHHVMNITDVDDKTIRKSQEKYPDLNPEEALSKIAKFYEEQFLGDLTKVGARLNTLDFIKATESIDIIQKLIIKLLDKEFAYISDDGIYFSIKNYKKSGKKYGQLVEIDDSNTDKARINNDEYDKNSVHDFVLWKFMKPNEPSWSFIINDFDYLGRPGWHIECSAMSESKLGKPFDLHTGGVDLKFPHHENEIAQSTSGENDPYLANIFCHNEHLLIRNTKMSKSLGNIFNLSDLEERGHTPLGYRLLILQSHYRSQASFSWELVEAADNRLIDLQNFAILKFQTKEKTKTALNFDEVKEKMTEALHDDLNTPKALAILSDFQSTVQDSLVSNSQKGEFIEFINFIDEVFGLNLNNVDNISNDQLELLNQRERDRAKSDWEHSDKIRDQLVSLNIGIRDTVMGQIWYRV